MSMTTRKSDARFVRAYVRSLLRSAFVSLFWAVITERRKREKFTFQGLAKSLGTNKGEVSRWFNGSPNWTLNTIAALADVLNVDIVIQAIDRETNEIFTPTGLLQTSVTAPPSNIRTTGVRTKGAEETAAPLSFTRIPRDSIPKAFRASISSMAA